MPLEEDVKQDVRKWSELFLEVPNTHLGGMPACPFAKKTWADKKVLVETKAKHKWYKSQLNKHIENLNFKKKYGRFNIRSKTSRCCPKGIWI